MSQQNFAHFDCRDHSWCCDSETPEPIDDDELHLPLRLNQLCEREHGLFASVGVHEGNRPYMEDRHRAIYARDGHRGYFAVHDGHGGSEAAQYLAEHLYEDLICAIDKKLRHHEKFRPDPLYESSKKQPPSSPSDEEAPKANGVHHAQVNGGSAPNKPPSEAASPAASGSPPESSANGAAFPSPEDGKRDAATPVSPLDVSVDVSVKSYHTWFDDDESEETAVLVEEALREGSTSCENHLLDCARQYGFTSGSTSVSVMVRGNRVYSINVGDSRAVLCRNGEAINLSEDHKPGVPAERERIEKHEGEVGQMIKSLPLCCAFFGEREKSVGAYRVWPGGLSVSRTFGDVNYKDPSLGKTHSPHILIADPDITVTELTPDDEFMILATDGFWDVLSSQDAVKFLRKKRRKRKFSPARAGAMLCDRAYNFGSGDNITCIVVFFTHHRGAWARTPHRSPDQLTRVPYRVDIAQSQPYPLSSSNSAAQDGEFKSLPPDEHASSIELAELSPQPPADESPESLPPTATPSSNSISVGSDPQSQSSSRNTRRPSESGSKSKRSYSRSRSKNDSTHGYRRDSQALDVDSKEVEALAATAALEANRPDALAVDSPAAVADAAVSSAAVNGAVAEEPSGAEGDTYTEPPTPVGVDTALAEGTPAQNRLNGTDDEPASTPSLEAPSVGHDRTLSSPSGSESTKPATKQDVRRSLTDPVISSNGVPPNEVSKSEHVHSTSKSLEETSPIPAEQAASEDACVS